MTTEFAPDLTPEERAHAEQIMEQERHRPMTPHAKHLKTRRWREKTGWPLGMRPDGTMNVVGEDGD